MWNGGDDRECRSGGECRNAAKKTRRDGLFSHTSDNVIFAALILLGDTDILFDPRKKGQDTLILPGVNWSRAMLRTYLCRTRVSRGSMEPPNYDAQDSIQLRRL